MYMSSDHENRLTEYLNPDRVSEGSLDYIACHGFMTAMAVRRDDFDYQDLLAIIIGDTPHYESSEQQQDVEEALEALAKAISRTLYLGDELNLPAALRPAKSGTSNDLTDWCFGFMEAIAVFEEDWFSIQSSVEHIAELILPITVYSEPHVDPELAHLVKTEKQQEALVNEIPENIQQLYLLFRD